MSEEPKKPKISCPVRLKSPPDCKDPKQRAAWAMCYAREKGVKEQHLDMKAAMKKGWDLVRTQCKLPPRPQS